MKAFGRVQDVLLDAFSFCRRIGGAPAAPGIVLVLLTGCFRTPPPADLRIINGPEPESLDPHQITGQADGRIALALFEGLTRYDPRTGQPVPGLAARWEVSTDGTVYTFHLRPEAAWSDGRPITTADVVWSWQRALAPATANEYAGALFPLRNARAFALGELDDFTRVGVRAVDARELQVELESPTPFFLDLLAYSPCTVVPRHVIEPIGDRWLHARPFAASGPYTLEFWRLNDRVRLRRNAFYWDAANVRCEVVDLLSCVSPNTALNLYESGAVDVVWDKELIPTHLLDELRRRADFHTYNFLGTYFIRCNVTKAPFNDPRVRRALALAVDKERLVRRITRGGERIAACLSPPGIMNGSVPYRPPAGLDHDPEAARRLLAEAGFPGGQGFPVVEYTYNTAPSHRNIALELRDMWQRELGLRLELRQLEWKTWLAAQSALDYDLIRSSWIGDYDDPNTFLDLFLSDNPNNRTGWRNGRYDALLREANAEPDAARRQERLAAAEHLLVAEALPVIPLYFYVGMACFDDARVHGIHLNLRGENPLWAIGKEAAPAPP
ncbi:MAG: peptide ABC transporter substrate-binding protein [Verrucomicrobiales bacterium]|nr:peptide ABC transporter substrate-binding protein [Verrucomicrobiales bacterium]